MVKVAKEKTKGKKVGCEAELTNHDSGYIQMEVCYSLYRTILPHYTMGHPLFVLSRLHLATIRAILPLPPRNFHEEWEEKTILETHTKSMYGGGYYLRGTRPPSANLISSTSAGLLSHRSRYSRARVMEMV